MKKPPATREDRIVFIVQNIDKLLLKSFQGGAYSRPISDYSLEKLNTMVIPPLNHHQWYKKTKKIA